MTDVKISGLSAKTTPAGTEEVPLNDGGTNKKMTLSNLVSLVTRALLGLDTTDSPQFTAVNVGHATDTTVTRTGAGDIAVEGNAVYRAGGTDVPVADGGTGSSTAAGAATNLGLGTGDSPQFTAVNVGHASDTTLARASAGNLTVEGNALYRAGGTDVPVVDGGTGASDPLIASRNLGNPRLTNPAGFSYSTMDRQLLFNDLAAETAGTLTMDLIWLPAGFVVTSISYMSGATALNTGTHQIFGLFDDTTGHESGTARSLLRATNDDTNTAWAAQTIKTLNLTSTYTVLTSGLFYLGVFFNATTSPSLKGNAPAAVNTGLVPILCGTSSTGLTTAMPNPAAAITATAKSRWCGVA